MLTEKDLQDIYDWQIDMNEQMHELKKTIYSSIERFEAKEHKEAIAILKKGTFPFWTSKKVKKFLETYVETPETKKELEKYRYKENETISDNAIVE